MLKNLRSGQGLVGRDISPPFHTMSAGAAQLGHRDPFSRWLVHVVGKLVRALLLLHEVLSTGWLGLPHSMVARCQEQAPKREKREAAIYLRPDHGNLQCQFHHILWVKQSQSPNLRRTGHRPLCLNGRYVKESWGYVLKLPHIHFKRKQNM